MSSASAVALTRLDHAVLTSTRRALVGTPAVRVAQGMSHVGERALDRLAVGALGCARGRRRGDRAAGTAGVLAAHGAGVVVERVVRRARPSSHGVPALVATPSRLPVPGAQRCSTAAAAVGSGPELVRPAMAVRRRMTAIHSRRARP